MDLRSSPNAYLIVLDTCMQINEDEEPSVIGPALINIVMNCWLNRSAAQLLLL